MKRATGLVAVAIALGCCGNPRSTTVCGDAEKRLGHSVCVHAIPDDDTWSAITYEAAAVDQARATTYMVPAKDGARLPTVFVDASGFDRPEQSLHFKFLTESFPDFRFLDYDQYLELILDPSTREWFAGSLTEYVSADPDPVYGFTIWDPGTDAATTISCEQFEHVYDVLESRVRVGALVAVPSGALQSQVLEDCSVPWQAPSTALDYEVYTAAAGCGTLRRYTPTELAAAEETAGFGWQDILVTQEAPLDIETIISGIVTGTRQGELSHLNVRSAARGTPNCYVKDATALLAPYEGKLVKLTCGSGHADVVEITPEEAQACWDELRPEPVEVVPVDVEHGKLVGLLDLPTADADERRTGVSRYGSKGTNLATLYQRIYPELQLDGFLIPLRYYDAFMTEGGFQDTLAGYLADPEFLSDGAVRRERLAQLQAEVESGACDADLIAALEAKMVEVWGSQEVMVRFRSSSNAEDALRFNGAGLYDSTSVCVADETDSDTAGPSRCDPDQPKERDVCRGLKKVWASLWNAKAYEERDWYGVDQREVGMGILVDTRTKDELSNIVAFTGNPLEYGDERYLVNAQVGAFDVVAAVPGVWPEKDLLTLEGHQVKQIERVRGSTELPEGEWVLDDARLRELGALLEDIAGVYPVDEVAPPGATVLLDTEWKLRSDRTLVVKQIRPFLSE